MNHCVIDSDHFKDDLLFGEKGHSEKVQHQEPSELQETAPTLCSMIHLLRKCLLHTVKHGDSKLNKVIIWCDKPLLFKNTSLASGMFFKDKLVFARNTWIPSCSVSEKCSVCNMAISFQTNILILQSNFFNYNYNKNYIETNQGWFVNNMKQQ